MSKVGIDRTKPTKRWVLLRTYQFLPVAGYDSAHACSYLTLHHDTSGPGPGPRRSVRSAREPAPRRVSGPRGRTCLGPAPEVGSQRSRATRNSETRLDRAERAGEKKRPGQTFCCVASHRNEAGSRRDFPEKVDPFASGVH